jgi:hypothetical protein
MSNAWSNFVAGAKKTAKAIAEGDAQGAAEAAAETAQSTAEGAQQDAQDVVDAVSEAASGAQEQAEDYYGQGVGAAKAGAQAVGEGAKEGVQVVGKTAKAGAQAVGEGAKEGVQVAAETVEGGVQAGMDAAGVGGGSTSETTKETTDQGEASVASPEGHRLFDHDEPPQGPAIDLAVGKSAVAERIAGWSIGTPADAAELAAERELLLLEGEVLRYDFESSRLDGVTSELGEDPERMAELMDRRDVLFTRETELVEFEVVVARPVDVAEVGDHPGDTSELGDGGSDSTADADAGTEGLPAGARVWLNRSDDPDSPYQHMSGPDIAFADDTWYARGDDGIWSAFDEGPVLDPRATFVTTEAFQFEVVSGTAMFPAGPADYGLRVDGATGGLVTPDGSVLDPHALEALRAADGTTAWFDTATGTWWSADLSASLAEPPAGPYHTTASGTGVNPPLDALGPGESYVFDPPAGLYHDPGTGAVTGFHQGRSDELRRWDNRSGDEGAGYDHMAGPSVVYFDGSWYGQVDDGTWYPFHQGAILDLHELDAPFSLEYLHYETLVDTPLFGAQLGDVGLRLDGERGALVDAEGNVVDPHTWDPDGTDPDALDAPTDAEGSDPAADIDELDADDADDADDAVDALDALDALDERVTDDGGAVREVVDVVGLRAEVVSVRVEQARLSESMGRLADEAPTLPAAEVQAMRQSLEEGHLVLSGQRVEVVDRASELRQQRAEPETAPRPEATLAPEPEPEVVAAEPDPAAAGFEDPVGEPVGSADSFGQIDVAGETEPSPGLDRWESVESASSVDRLVEEPVDDPADVDLFEG